MWDGGLCSATPSPRCCRIWQQGPSGCGSMAGRQNEAEAPGNIQVKRMLAKGQICAPAEAELCARPRSMFASPLLRCTRPQGSSGCGSASTGALASVSSSASSSAHMEGCGSRRGRTVPRPQSIACMKEPMPFLHLRARAHTDCGKWHNH